MNSQIRFYASLFVFVFLFSAAAQAFSDRVYTTKQFDVTGPVVLNAGTSGGSITVESHESNKVMVDVIIRRGSSYFTGDFDDIGKLTFEQNGNNITVEASVDRGFFRTGTSVSVSYVIKTPVETSVNVRSSGGSLTLNGVEGNQQLRTSGGSISLSEISGEVEARTSGGGITMNNISGELNARTSGGSISMKNSSGNFNVHTSGGSINLENIAGNMSARTSGGSITGNFTEIDRHLSLRTSAGSISATLPSVLTSADGKGLRLDARGSRVNLSGETHTGFEGRMSGRQVSGVYGKGGVSAEFRTSAGNVNITYR